MTRSCGTARSSGPQRSQRSIEVLSGGFAMESARKIANNPFRLVAVLRVAFCVAMTTFLGIEADPGKAATVQAQASYHGVTSQGLPVYVKTSDYGVLIRRTSIPVEVACPSGSVVIPERFQFVPVTRSGRFHDAIDESGVEEEKSIHVQAALSG